MDLQRSLFLAIAGTSSVTAEGFFFTKGAMNRSVRFIENC